VAYDDPAATDRISSSPLNPEEPLTLAIHEKSG